MSRFQSTGSWFDDPLAVVLLVELLVGRYKMSRKNAGEVVALIVQTTQPRKPPKKASR